MNYWKFSVSYEGIASYMNNTYSHTHRKCHHYCIEEFCYAHKWHVLFDICLIEPILLKHLEWMRVCMCHFARSCSSILMSPSMLPTKHSDWEESEWERETERGIFISVEKSKRASRHTECDRYSCVTCEPDFHIDMLNGKCTTLCP